MERVDVKFGFLCNNKCIFCVQGNKREIYGDIPLPEVLSTLKKARHNSDSIVFTGGEITIKPHFLFILEKAKELGFSKIQIQTNGRMFADLDYLNSRTENENRELLKPLNDPYLVCKDAHAIAILTEWDEFVDYDWQRIYENMMKPAFIFDGRNILDKEKLQKIGFTFYGIGKS